MNILHVNMSMDPITGGGTAERTFQISLALATNGNNCTILTTDIGMTDERRLQFKNIKLIALSCIWKRLYLFKFSSSELRSIVQDTDIIHLMGHWTLINALIFLLARRYHKPYVVCPAGALPNVGRNRVAKWLYNQLVGFRIVRMACACIAISRNEIDHFTSYNISRNKIRVIPNGVDPADFQFRDDKTFRQKYAIGDGPFILFVGRLNHIKGPDLLIRAFSLIQKDFENLQLVLAGPDEGLKAKLIRIINELHLLKRIHFIGYVGGKDKSFAYHAADLLVIPSRQEAMSIVVLEAGMCGTPVVLTDRCGFNAVEEVSGGKVVPATVDGLAHGIQNILSRSTNNGLFGANLKKFVKKHFIWDVIVQNYVDLYKTILPCETA